VTHAHGLEANGRGRAFTLAIGLDVIIVVVEATSAGALPAIRASSCALGGRRTVRR